MCIYCVYKQCVCVEMRLKLTEEKEEFLKIKKDVVNAYIKLFGEEQGKALLIQLYEKKKELWKQRNNDAEKV